MSRIAVLDHNQLVTDKPRIWRKASICKRLVRSGVASWLIKGVLLRLLTPEEIRIHSDFARAEIKARKILQTPWESPELPGLRFEAPNIRQNPDAVIVRSADQPAAGKLGIAPEEILPAITNEERTRLFLEYAAAI